MDNFINFFSPATGSDDFKASLNKKLSVGVMSRPSQQGKSVHRPSEHFLMHSYLSRRTSRSTRGRCCGHQKQAGGALLTLRHNLSLKLARGKVCVISLVNVLSVSIT